MFAVLLCLLTLHQVHSACVVKDICTENKAVQNVIVNLHNQLRKNVQPPASDMLLMTWSDEVAANAQAWVDKCILAHGEARTRMLNGYELGENLFYSSTPFSWRAVISDWYNEVQNYQYPSGSTNRRSIGHYTQVIWNSSFKVGCGMTLCPNNIYFYGCHYYRAGNFRAWPPYTKGAPCGQCREACENNLCTNPCPYINRYINCQNLKDYFGCDSFVSENCPALCKCSNEIIPIA